MFVLQICTASILDHLCKWLMQTISGLGELWEGVELTVVDSKDLPKRPRVLVRIPDTSEVTTCHDTSQDPES
jgi:hypothetical protein